MKAGNTMGNGKQYVYMPDNAAASSAHIAADYYNSLRGKGVPNADAVALTQTYITTLAQVTIAQMSTLRQPNNISMAEIRDYVAELMRQHMQEYHNDQ